MNEYIQIYDETAMFERLCNIVCLKIAFRAVKQNKGACGIDGQTIEQFDANLDNNLRALKNELESWTYVPQPVRRVEIAKPGGRGVRQLAFRRWWTD